MMGWLLLSSLGCVEVTGWALTRGCFCPADKPQVRVSQNYPVQGLTREGEPLELTCTAFGKPQ